MIRRDGCWFALIGKMLMGENSSCVEVSLMMWWETKTAPVSDLFFSYESSAREAEWGCNQITRVAVLAGCRF
jgi:hypothetical protein